MGEGHRGIKEMHTRREKIRIGQREQASKINVRGGKIQNNKVGGGNFHKEWLWSREGHAVFSHKRERERAQQQSDTVI